MTCLRWSKPSNRFRELCINTLKLETPPNGYVNPPCAVCVVPVFKPGNCADCIPEPAFTYRVTPSIDGNGPGSGTPSAGCCSDYNREFLCYAYSSCEWRSEELELGASGSGGTVTCTDVALGPRRSRVVLRAFRTLISGIERTVWTVTVNWKTLSGSGFPGYLTKNHIIARGHASIVDCYEPVTAPYYSRELKTGLGGSGFTQWANPCCSGTNGGFDVTMSATVEPL
jgi:hypothetical protein